MSKFISLDIETTGLDPKQDQILSIGIVIEDTKNRLPIKDLPFLHLILYRDRIQGNAFAINMNRDLIAKINKYKSLDEDGITELESTNNEVFVKEFEVVHEIFEFLSVHNMLDEDINSSPFGDFGKFKNGNWVSSITNNTPVTTLTVAGKNVAGFDIPFIKTLPNINKVFRFHQRTIDPAILYMDWENDEVLPNLQTCMGRAGVEGEVTHSAIQDAIDIIKVLRTTY
jgi:oligoribonuclease (3'-5' exoribonuclease)